MISFGQRLRFLREKKGLSQDQLAQLVGVKSGKQTISKWERDAGDPSLPEIHKMIEVLETTARYLVDGLESGQAVPLEVPPGQILMDAGEVIKMQRELLELKSQTANK